MYYPIKLGTRVNNHVDPTLLYSSIKFTIFCILNNQYIIYMYIGKTVKRFGQGAGECQSARGDHRESQHKISRG